jgi:hypothetical protein
MEKFDNFCLQKWIFAVFAFLVPFLPFFGLVKLDNFPVFSTQTLKN